MSVKKIESVKVDPIATGNGVSRQVLIGPDEGPNFAMRKFVIKAGGHMPRHTNTVEHEQYVLNGRARIAIGDQEFEVKKDDIVYIPAGVPHWYKTLGDEAFEFLCMVPNKEDKIEVIE